MFSIVLTPDEIAFLSQMLQLKPDEYSPIHKMATAKLSESDKKKIEKALKKGNTIVTDSQTKKDRVNIVATAALGIVANPQSMLDILVTSKDKQNRRSFMAYKDTWLGFNQDGEAYILTTPVTDEMIRDFVFMHLQADQLSEKEVVLADDALILASVIFDLYREARDSAKLSFTLKDIQNNLMNNTKASLTFYREVYGAITEESIEKQLKVFTQAGYLKQQKESYSLQGELLKIAQVLNEQKSIQISRFDREGKNPDIRTLTLLQGKKKLILQQTILAKTPVLVFKEIDKDYAAMVLTIAVRSADEFAREYKKFFDKMESLNQNSEKVEELVKKAQAKAAADKEKEAKQAKAKESEKKIEQEKKKDEKPTPLPTPEPSQPAIAKQDKPIAEETAKEQPAKDEPTSSPAAVIKCPSCHADLPDGAKFCKSCGHKIESADKCPGCQAELPAGAKFCRHCGHKID